MMIAGFQRFGAWTIVGMMIMSGLVAVSMPVIAHENLTGTAGIQAIWNNDWMIDDSGVPAADEQIVLNYDFTNAKLYYLGDDETRIQITFQNGATAMDIDSPVTFTLSVGTGNTLITVGETSTFTLNPPAAGQSPWIASATANALFTIDIGNSGIVETTYPMRVSVQYTLFGATETNILNFEVYLSSRLHPAGNNLARDTRHEMTKNSGDYIRDNENDPAFEAGDTFKEGAFTFFNRGPDAITDPELTLTPPAGFTLAMNHAKFVGNVIAGTDVDLLWRFDIATRTPPGIYTGVALVTYRRMVTGIDKAITENIRPIDFTADFSFKDTDPAMDTDAYSQFQLRAMNINVFQKSPGMKVFNLTVENNGNTILNNLRFYMNANMLSIFDDPKFFWEIGGITYYDYMTPIIATLNVGEMVVLNVEAEFLSSVPLGTYFLNGIDYFGYYFDDGSLGGSSGSMQTNGGSALELMIELHLLQDLPPFCNMILPNDTELISGIYTFRVLAQDDNGVLNATLKIGTMFYPMILNAGFYEYTLNTALLDDGPKTIEVIVFDESGLSASDTVNVVIDNTPPTLIVQSPLNGQFITTAMLQITIESDDVTMNKVQYQMDSGGWIDLVSAGTALWGAQISTTGILEGTRALSFRAMDNATHEVSTTITVTVDKNAPLCTLVSPANGASLSGINTMMAHASDYNGISGVKIEVENSTGSIIVDAPLGYNTISGYWEGPLDTTVLAKGNYTIYTTATDNSGRLTQTTGNFIILDQQSQGTSTTTIWRNETIYVNDTVWNNQTIPEYHNITQWNNQTVPDYHNTTVWNNETITQTVTETPAWAWGAIIAAVTLGVISVAMAMKKPHRKKPDEESELDKNSSA